MSNLTRKRNLFKKGTHCNMQNSSGRIQGSASADRNNKYRSRT